MDGGPGRKHEACVTSGGRGFGFVLWVLLSCSSLGMAQLDTGTISGTVTDQSGGAVPGAAITIRNVATGVSRRVETNARGGYEAAALPVGNYEVSASLAGFQTLVRSGIELTVGRNAVVDLALQVGEVTQAITITGEASHVETTSATVSNLVDEKRVLEIPLNNRDLTQLAYFQPGVLKIPRIANYNFGNSLAGGLGDQLSVGGARGTQNVYLTDGVSNSDLSGNAQTATGAYSGAETVQEFQIITNNYSAEYPSKPGAIVSAVTKSGTNAFHGSLYEFLRNDNLDAAKWEDNALSNGKPEFKRNQFGGSLGGPIVRDRTFFFGSYEGLRERLSFAETVTVPTADGRQGILGRNANGNPIKTVTVAPQVKPYLNVWPLPGEGGHSLATDYNNGTALLGATQRNQNNDDFATVKMDHQFASPRKGFLAFTYSVSDGARTTFPDLPSSAIDAYTTRKHVISARHTSILSPTVLNEFVFGHTRTEVSDAISVDYDFTNVNGANLIFVPGKKVMGQISVSQLNSIGDFFDNIGEIFKTRLLTFKDSLSLTRPSHTIKFGAEVNRSRYPYRDNFRTAGGFEFDGLEQFLTATPRRFRIALPKGVPILGEPMLQIYNYNLRQSTFGFYVQDNYKVLPSLTLNLGLRYEFQTLPSERDGNWWNLRHLTDQRLTRGQFFTNPTLRDFSPRFGFAWAPGSHKTSLRGGFGVYYDYISLIHLQHTTSQMPPASSEPRINDTDAEAVGRTLRFPDLYTAQYDLFQNLGAPEVRTIEFNQKPTYVYRWSLTLEREMGPWFVSAGYTGSRARHLWVYHNADVNRWIGWPENVPPDQKRFPASGGIRFNPAFSILNVQSPNGNSYYHGLTLNVMRRLSSGLQFQGAYTLSKNIDQSAGTTNVTEGLAQNQVTVYYWDMAHQKGRSVMDIRNNFVGNITYETPRTALTGLAGALANGWQVNGILTLSDGHAFSITDTNTAQTRAFGDAAGVRPNLIPGGNNDPALGGPTSYYDVTQFVPSVCRGGQYCYNTRDNPKFDARFAENAARPDLGYAVGYYGNLGYNTMTGPGLVTFDFSLNKNLQLTERNRLQFRAEFFNLFNRVNFFLPDFTPFLNNGTRDPAAGTITKTRTSARQIQFGLKYIF